MDKSANFSPCGKYRYRLTRRWSDVGDMAMCIGLNPSTANAEKNDNTIDILTNTLRWHEYAGFYMMNLYALITSKPALLFTVPDSLGDNEQWIQRTYEQSKDVIFCWGAFKNIEYRAKKMIERFPGALCFGKTKNGSPWHPRALHYAGIRFDQTQLLKF